MVVQSAQWRSRRSRSAASAARSETSHTASAGSARRCGRSWNTAQIPAEEYEQLLRSVRRHKLEALLAAGVSAAILAPLIIFVSASFISLVPLAMVGWLVGFLPRWRRRYPANRTDGAALAAPPGVAMQTLRRRLSHEDSAAVGASGRPVLLVRSTFHTRRRRSRSRSIRRSRNSGNRSCSSTSRRCCRRRTPTSATATSKARTCRSAVRAGAARVLASRAGRAVARFPQVRTRSTRCSRSSPSASRRCLCSAPTAGTSP